jgi:hypothetical protein
MAKGPSKGGAGVFGSAAVLYIPSVENFIHFSY